MCNIAGYVGSQPAAPILIEMMRLEEGWAGGYYTGLATIHEGKIHHAKVVGSLDDLLRNTDAASLPGTVGIIHSRSKSGGDVKWAHPFIGGRDGAETAAYVANGSQGYFAQFKRDVAPISARLDGAGYRFSSREPFAVGDYPVLPDGACVHMSDVMAQLIASRIDSSETPAEAMSSAYCEMPSEIVGLLLSIETPDRIAWSRINMPMFAGFAGHGAYLASTPLCFPADAGNPTLLPACSGGYVFNDHYTVKPYAVPPCRVANVDARLIAEAYTVIEKALSEEKLSFSKLHHLIQPLFEDADCVPSAAIGYAVMHALQRQNRFSYTVQIMPGAQENLSAPQFLAEIK